MTNRRRPRYGRRGPIRITAIDEVNPTAASAPFGGMGDCREGSHEGIAEYLETKLGGFAI